MGLIKRVSRRRHWCNPPGWLKRWNYDIGVGSLWRCPVCTSEWERVEYPDGVTVWRCNTDRSDDLLTVEENLA